MPFTIDVDQGGQSASEDEAFLERLGEVLDDDAASEQFADLVAYRLGQFGVMLASVNLRDFPWPHLD